MQQRRKHPWKPNAYRQSDFLFMTGATDQRNVVNLNRMKDMRCVAAVIVYFHSRSLSETQVGSPAKLSPVGQGPAGRLSVVTYCIWYFVLFCLNIDSGNGLSSSVLEVFETWGTSNKLMLNPQSQKIISTRRTTDSPQALSVKYHFFDFITRKGNPFCVFIMSVRHFLFLRDVPLQEMLTKRFSLRNWKKRRKFWFSCHRWFQWFRFKSKHRLTSWTLVSVELLLSYTKNKMHSVVLLYSSKISHRANLGANKE